MPILSLRCFNILTKLWIIIRDAVKLFYSSYKLLPSTMLLQHPGTRGSKTRAMVKFIYNKNSSISPFVPHSKSIKKAEATIPFIVFVMDEKSTWRRFDLAKAIGFVSLLRSRKKGKS